ncbi:hypothetical protein [Microbacterium deminutum]|uniref:ATP-grasp domain-containing protein n=1 Tax=Microbacterium deminutum TaxID=344164 RepID=A0ABP5BWL9_9MICO
MNDNKPIVLIGFSQAFAAIEAAWSLQAAGLRVVAFGRRGVRTALSRIRGVDVMEITAPESSVAGALADLEHAIKELGPSAVLPLDDASLWLLARTNLGEVTLIGPSRNGADLALDKSEQLTAAERAGFAVPPTLRVRDGVLTGDVAWPIVLKAADAVRQEGDRLVRPRGAICADWDELTAALPTLGAGELLCQPLLSGTGEGIFGFADESGPTALSAHRRVRMVNPHGSASSACESIDVESSLIAPVERLLDSVGWTGLFMVELLRDKSGVAWFMELNGRAWGSLALARRRGYEYPAWAAQHSLGLARRPALPAAPPRVLARHLGRELAHFLFVLRGPQSAAVKNWPSRGRTALDLLTVTRQDRLYNWNARQPSVLAADTIGTLTELVSGRKRT